MLDLVDVFLFLCDARIPGTSVKLAGPFLARQKRVYILAKPDLADPEVTKKWISHFEVTGVPAFAVDCQKGDGLEPLLAYLRHRRDALNEKRPEGVAERPLRVMLYGPPNVGKSSLANRLLGTQKAPFGAKPGLTRASRWLTGRGFLQVLDTPGVVETAQVKGEARLKLAAVWALPDTDYDQGDLAVWIAKKVAPRESEASPDGGRPCTAGGKGGLHGLGSEAAKSGDAGFGDKPHDLFPHDDDAAAVRYIEEFGRQRGFLRQGGVVDADRACKAVIHEFREGRLGRFTLEEPVSR